MFTAPLIERRQLQKLLVRDLKHYLTTRRIDYPLNVTAEELIDLILGHQAHSLAEKTKRALEQLSGHSEANVDIEDLDPSALLPHTSAYSSDLAGQSSVSRYSGAQIRAEVKRKTELAKVNVSDIVLESRTPAYLGLCSQVFPSQPLKTVAANKKICDGSPVYKAE